MISQKSIQEIRETAKVEDIVGEFVTLKKRGVNLIGLCPFHNEKTPSFTVSPAKNIYKCFGCGESGGPINFVMEHESLTYPEALRYVAKKYNIELDETVPSTETGKLIGLPYFRERGFNEETIKKFGLGYAPKGGKLFTEKAIKTGYKLELLQKAGVTSQKGYDFFRDRMMFVIHNLTGKVIGFGGRTLLCKKQVALRHLFCQNRHSKSR